MVPAKNFLRKRLLPRFFFLALLLPLAGCNSGQDTNEILYISLIGIDAHESGKISVTYQFENLKEKADSDKEPDKSPDNVITIQGDNFPQTIDFLTAIVSHTPNFSHVRAIIFGEEMARRGVYEFVTLFSRSDELRSNTYIIVINNATAREFISHTQNTIESSVSRYVETHMALSEYTNLFLKSNIHEFYRRLKSNSAASFAALGGIAQEARGEKKAGAPENLEDIYAGSIPRQGSANPIELAGTALFRQDKMIGALNAKETLFASILLQDFEKCMIQIDDPQVPGYQVSVELETIHAPKIKVKLTEGGPKIKIKLDFTCAIKNIPSGFYYENPENSKELEKAIIEHLTEEMTKMLTKTKELGADIVGFGYRARTQFKTYPEFMAIKWTELYTQAEFDVEINAAIRDTALMGRTTPMSP